MSGRQGYHPTYPHPQLTKALSTQDAQDQLARFLRRTESKPYLHPDSILSNVGISYSAQSGPSGGLALHHLRRIEAGLRGENLVAETADELAQFNETVLEKDEADALMSQGHRKSSLKRKRTAEEVGDWAERSSQAASGAQQEETDLQDGRDNEWQSQQEFEREQEPWTGEVGQRDGAPVVRQNADAPQIVVHAEDGKVKGKKSLSANDKLARKAAKKERKKEERKKAG